MFNIIDSAFKVFSVNELFICDSVVDNFIFCFSFISFTIDETDVEGSTVGGCISFFFEFFAFYLESSSLFIKYTNKNEINAKNTNTTIIIHRAL